MYARGMEAGMQLGMQHKNEMANSASPNVQIAFLNIQKSDIHKKRWVKSSPTN